MGNKSINPIKKLGDENEMNTFCMAMIRINPIVKNKTQNCEMKQQQTGSVMLDSEGKTVGHCSTAIETKAASVLV